MTSSPMTAMKALAEPTGVSKPAPVAGGFGVGPGVRSPWMVLTGVGVAGAGVLVAVGGTGVGGMGAGVGCVVWQFTTQPGSLRMLLKAMTTVPPACGLVVWEAEGSTVQPACVLSVTV